MTSELKVKTERIVAMLANENLHGVLMNAQHNFSWLTSGGSNGIDLSRENGAGFLLVTRDGNRYLIANNIERSRLINEEIPNDTFEPIEIEWQAERDPQSVLNAARSVADGADLGCDIGFPETHWVEPSIASCRFQLLPAETDRFRVLGRDAGKALQDVISNLDPGQTEKQ